MKLHHKLLFISLLSIPTTALAHTGATGIVKERMDHFKESKASIKVLKQALKEQDFKTITKEATAINLWARKLTTLFPEGSNAHPSEALDLIWQEFDRFEEKAKEQITASRKLINAGNDENEKASISAFKELATTCKSCHNKYRE